MLRAAGPFSLTVLSRLPPLRLLLLPMKPGSMLDIGRRLRRGALVLLEVGVMPNELLSLFLRAAAAAAPAPNADFSLSAFSYSSFSRFFLPKNQSRRAAIIPTIAMIPIARPALAPVDMPPSLELDEDEVAASEVSAAPATAVLDARSLADVRKEVGAATMLVSRLLDAAKVGDASLTKLEVNSAVALVAAAVEPGSTEVGGPSVKTPFSEEAATLESPSANVV